MRRQVRHDRRALQRGDREPAQLALAHHRQDRAHVLQGHGDAAADHVGEHRAAIGHVDDVDAGLPLEQFAGDVLRRADAGRRIGQLARLRLGERDEFGKALRRHVVVDGENARHHQKTRHRRKVALHVVGLAGQQRRVDGQRAVGAPIEGGAVGRGFRHAVAADAAAGARHVLDRHRDVPRLLEFLREQPRRDVGRAAGGEADDEAHRLVGIWALRRGGRDDQHRHQGGKPSSDHRSLPAAASRHSTRSSIFIAPP